MQWFLIGIAVFVGVGFFIRWMTEAEPKEIRKIVLFLIILVLILLAGWLLLTGKIAAMGAALVAAVPFLVRLMKFGFLWPIFRRIFSASQKRAQPGSFGNQTAGAGSSSEIRTEFLHMVLDLESGQMRGGVVSGRYAGADLDSLGLDDLQSLYVDCCSATDQSRAVLEAYLDRRPDCAGWQNWRQEDHGEDGAQNGGNDRNYNEQGHGGERSSSASGMTADEARKILGVGQDATREEINRAYKKQIKAVHPDHGGSDYLASKINAARSLLLRLCKD
ncbi:DnaJ domain-containing protein [Thalassospira sp. HF15]|uniref:J domain-containing protein n=1 Tax=Thalassospira sp. HF15 TaxID=2722755 RepID=UPI00142FA0CA|nr:DnaJ domain-containing protein [Thalassospira sp. HF15]NIY77179.1 DnaJ domain-containing protein [Thalassospira sp. HF15]